MDDDRRQALLRGRCTRHLAWHGDRSPSTLLAELPGDVAPDRYLDGGVVAELEAEVAALLDKPAAAFMPTGTMAQQIALRLHAEDRGRRTVVMHHRGHPNLWEGEALTRLHDLVVRTAGDADRPLVVADLVAIAEPVAALLVELPQRELGGVLPPWDGVTAQVQWARTRGAAAHLDGARLWEAAAGYDVAPAVVAAPFDTVYVSLYKGIGAIAGAALVGSESHVARAKEWRHRLGGRSFAAWPVAAHALTSLRARAPRMRRYRDHAIAIADALARVEGIEVDPSPPHTSMFHVSLRTTVADYRVRATQLALDDGVWTWPTAWPARRARWCRVELTVGDATVAFTPQEVAGIMGRLVTPVDRGDPATEPVEVLDESGAVTAVVSRQRIRAEGLRHRCTYVVVLTSDDEVVVHRRAEWKDVDPGAWDLAFGGLCDVGEPWAEAAARELAEEAGLSGLPLTELGEVAWADDEASLIGRVYVTEHDGAVSSPDGEAVAFDRVPLARLDTWLDGRQVCPDSAAVVPELLRAHRAGAID